MRDDLLKTVDDDRMLFIEELGEESVPQHSMGVPWRIMIVDDDENIHQITRMILNDYQFQGRNAELLHAYSAAEAWELIQANPDTALIILDVIMETDNAGLQLVRNIRSTLGNSDVRILLRTGQPGMFNEYQIAMEYEINEYKEKAGLTSDKLLASITTLLREYSGLVDLHRQREDLEINIDRLTNIARIIDESRIATLALDENLRIASVNSAFSKLTGYDAKYAKGKIPLFLQSENNNEDLLKAAWGNLLDSDSWEGELWCRTAAGNDINIRLSASTLHNDDDSFSGIALQFSDITQIKEQEKQLLNWATQDPLTKLPNRNHFFFRLEETLSNSERRDTRFALLFIDLDYFKKVNDEMGHTYGDELLKQVGRRLQQCIRKSDILARVGGDEFTAIIGNFTDRKQVESVAKKINAALARPFKLDGREAVIAGSVGIALYPQDATEPEQLYHLADLAMYQAKSKGRSTYCFYSRKAGETRPAGKSTVEGIRRS
jgi:two-component system cell cycle response regulator